MFEKKTVMVVGAGASAEVNLPVGKGLKEGIARLLRFEQDGFGRPTGDRIILSALGQHSGHPRLDHGDMLAYFDAAAAIREAMPQAISMDHFVDAHNGDDKIELCSKLAITR